jgi:oligopeptide transport system ATP-binding protein
LDTVIDIKTEEMLKVENLTKKFLIKKQKMPWQKKKYVHVLNGINFTINEGEAFGLVGESGCGKSTTAKVIMDIYSPTTGSIKYNSTELTGLKGKEKKAIRKDIQYVFQDPMGALNPRIAVIEQIYEPLITHGKMYPHQLSGGQRQRVVLARAMILEPEMLICDEPISALDVSIQAQVVNLLMKIREEKGITLLFISHDLSMVRHLCDRTVVMYMGNIVEFADRETLFNNPLHPYTKSLINAIPIPDPRIKREETILEGEIPSLLHPPSGCRFHSRCPIAMPECSIREPELKILPDGRQAACLALEEGVKS